MASFILKWIPLLVLAFAELAMKTDDEFKLASNLISRRHKRNQPNGILYSRT